MLLTGCSNKESHPEYLEVTLKNYDASVLFIHRLNMERMLLIKVKLLLDQAILNMITHLVVGISH